MDRKISWIILFFLLLGGVCIAFRPLSFQHYSGQTFQLLSIQDATKVEHFSAFPDAITEAYRICSSDAGYEDLIDGLASSKFRRCFYTLFSDWFPDAPEGAVIRISWPMASVYLSGHSFYLIVNGVVYHLIAPSDLYQTCSEVMTANRSLLNKN